MDISKPLKSLNDLHVRFVLIGASAFPSHGYMRLTNDVDILIEPTRENAQRTLASLDDLIKMKRAANRPKDREDLKALLAIKRIQNAKSKEKKPYHPRQKK